METTRVDAVKEFKTSQPFIDSCSIYYGDGFEDCLKQVKCIYLNLDLSKVTMDDPMPSIPADDTIFEEIDDSTESEPDPKDDSVVLTQPTVDPPIIPSIPSIKPLNVEDPPFYDVHDKNDENNQDASWP